MGVLDRLWYHDSLQTIYPHRYDGPHSDWPPYRPVEEMPEQVEHVPMECAALIWTRLPPRRMV
jgi:hypothetical protein